MKWRRTPPLPRAGAVTTKHPTGRQVMSPMFRKKPVVIEAHQWTGDNILALWDHISAAFLYGPTPAEDAVEPDADGKGCPAQPARPARLYVAANDAWLNLEVSEWIIKDSLGYYPCKSKVFDVTYEAVAP